MPMNITSNTKYFILKYDILLQTPGVSLNYPSLCVTSMPQADAALLRQMKSRKCILRNLNHVKAGSSNQPLEVIHRARKVQSGHGIRLLRVELKSALGEKLTGPLDENATGNFRHLFRCSLRVSRKRFAIGTQTTVCEKKSDEALVSRKQGLSQNKEN